MAGTPAELPGGVRLSDHIRLGVIAKAFPPEQVRQIWPRPARRASAICRHAIALALYMGSSTREVLRCLLEGVR